MSKQNASSSSGEHSQQKIPLFEIKLLNTFGRSCRERIVSKSCASCFPTDSLGKRIKPGELTKELEMMNS